jgi:hypothetical protein
MAKTVSPAISTSISDVPRYVWAEVATGDTINALKLVGAGARRAAVQVAGNFGGATVKIQTSNDGTNFADIKDIHNTAVTTTAAAVFEITSAAVYIKPVISGGTSDSVNVTLCIRD